jgi:hypothetical protein
MPANHTSTSSGEERVHYRGRSCKEDGPFKNDSHPNKSITSRHEKLSGKATRLRTVSAPVSIYWKAQHAMSNANGRLLTVVASRRHGEEL